MSLNADFIATFRWSFRCASKLTWLTDFPYLISDEILMWQLLKFIRDKKRNLKLLRLFKESNLKIPFIQFTFKYPQLTWLTKATKTILLIHTDAVHTRRGLALVHAVLTEGPSKASCAIATAMGNNATLRDGNTHTHTQSESTNLGKHREQYANDIYLHKARVLRLLTKLNEGNGFKVETIS